MSVEEAKQSARRHLARLDRALPGRIVGFHLIGSSALGAWRPGRSDIDYVAVVDGRLDADGLRALRRVHIASGLAGAASALARGRSPLTGTRNGVFVDAADWSRPVDEIAPLASHTAQWFSVGEAFDVNPVMWKLLAERGVALRGEEAGRVVAPVDAAQLRAWNLANLDEYWAPWGRGVSRRPSPDVLLRARWWCCWGVLGPPRLHRTIATGDIVSKEDAGAYALDVFPARWHPLIADGLAYRRGEPFDRKLGGPIARLREVGEFVLEVVASAKRLGAPSDRA